MDSAKMTSDGGSAHIAPARRGTQHPNPELPRLLRAEELLAEMHQLDESGTPAPLFHPSSSRAPEGSDAPPSELHP